MILRILLFTFVAMTMSFAINENDEEFLDASQWKAVRKAMNPYYKACEKSGPSDDECAVWDKDSMRIMQTSISERKLLYYRKCCGPVIDSIHFDRIKAEREKSRKESSYHGIPFRD